MVISFNLYFTHEFKGLDRQIECLRLWVQSPDLSDSPDIIFNRLKIKTRKHNPQSLRKIAVSHVLR